MKLKLHANRWLSAILATLLLCNPLASAFAIDTNDTPTADLLAQDFSITLAQAATLNAEEAAALARLSFNGEAVASDAYSVNEAQLQAITQATQADTFPLTFEVADQSATVDVTIASDQALPAPEDTSGNVSSKSLEDAPEFSPSNLAFSATFDGVDLSSSSSTFTGEQRNLRNIPRTLHISESFTNEFADKKIVIELAEGLSLYSAPGMQSNDKLTDWSFDAANITDVSLKNFIVEGSWTQAPSYKGKQPRGGTLTLKLSSGINSIDFDVQVIADEQYFCMPTSSAIMGSYTIDNAIKVTTTDNGVTLNTATLESYTVNPTPDINYDFLMSGTGTPRAVAARNGTYSTHYMFSFRSANSSIGDFMVDAIELKFSAPKSAGVEKIKVNGKEQSDLDAAFTYDIDSSDATNDIITVKLDGATKFECTIWFIGTVDSSVPEGSELYILQTSMKLTTWNGNTIQQVFPTNNDIAYCWTWNPRYIFVPYTTPTLKPVDVQDGINIKEKNTPSALKPLGSFKFTNESSAVVTGRRARINFDTDYIGVQALTVFAGLASEKITNVKVHTTNGDLLETDAIENYKSYASWRYAKIVPGTPASGMRALNDGEYIDWVEYTMGTVPVGYDTEYGFSHAGSTSSVSNPAYYGQLLNGNVGESYVSTMEILKPSSDGNWETECTLTNTVTIKSETSESILLVANKSVGATLVAGQTETITLHYSYDNLYRYGGVLSSHKGFAGYIKQVPGTIVDASSIQVQYGETILSEDSDYTVSTLTSEDGDTIYQITLPDVILGWNDKELIPYGELQISADIKADKTAPTTTYPLSDVMFGRALNVSPSFFYNHFGRIGGSSNMSMQWRNTDSAIPSGLWIIAPPKHVLLKITKNTNFNVATSSKNNTEITYKTYDGTKDTYIDLNKQVDAQYRVNVLNNTGQVVNEFSVLVPIPKAGENTNSPDIQKVDSSGDFQWSLNITEPVQYLPTGCTATYATTYELNRNSADFKEWNEISDPNEIRMVLIRSLNNFADGDSLSAILNLSVAENLSNPTEWQGKLNIYKARVYQSIAGATGGHSNGSEEIALRVNYGKVSGKVLRDDDYNDTISDSDTGYSNITVIAYEPGTNTKVDETTTDSLGNYVLYGLSTEKVDIEFKVPAGISSGGRFNDYQVTGSSADQITGQSEHNQNLRIANIQPSSNSAQPVTVDALLETPFAVSFHAPDGTTLPAIQYVYFGDKATIPSLTPTMLGYHFNNWYTTDAYTAVFDFANTSIHNDTVVYAKMQPNTYSIRFHNNGGTGVMEDLSMTYTEKKTLTTNGFSKSGYTFRGWTKSLEELDTVYYSDKQEVWNMTAEQNGIVDLYAVWGTNNQELTIQTDNATQAGANEYPKSIILQAGTNILNALKAYGNPEKVGFEFVNWVDNSDNPVLNNQTMPETTGYTVKAIYTPNTYTVTYNSNGEVSKKTATYGSDFTFDAGTSITRPGYTFKEWYDEANNEIHKPNEVIKWSKLTDISLEAIWTANEQTLILNTDGGLKSDGTAYQTSLPVSTDAGVLDALTNLTHATALVKTGYQFRGWVLDDGTNTPVDANTLMPASDLRVKATWSRDTNGGSSNGSGSISSLMKIVYDANTGSGGKTVSERNGATHTVLSESDASVKREDYTFQSWNTKADGSGKTYAAGDTITINADTTLYAQWVQKIAFTKEHIPYLTGYANQTIGADNAITRAEAATIFYRLLSTQGTAAGDTYSDVSADAWYATAVNYLSSLKILSGYPDGSFQPNAFISRAEFSAIAARFDALEETRVNTFSDVPDNHWAVNYINSAYNKGWIRGYGDNTFRPENAITRAEVVSVINTMCNRKADADALQDVTNPFQDLQTSHWAYADIMEASISHQFDYAENGTELWKH